MGYTEIMNAYELTPDGLVRRAGRVVDEISPLEAPPTLPGIVPELTRIDDEAAQRFVRIAQMPSTTQLTAPAS